MDAKSEPAGEAEFDSLGGRWRGRGCGDLDLNEVGTGPGVGLTTRLAPFEEGLIRELVLSTKGGGSGVGLIEFREPALTILLGVVSSGRHARHHIPNLHPAEIYADGPLGRLRMNSRANKRGPPAHHIVLGFLILDQLGKPISYRKPKNRLLGKTAEIIAEKARD